MLETLIQSFLNPDKKELVSQNDAAFVVLPFPLEFSTSYIQGTRQGPQAILDASSQIEFFDPELQTSPINKGIYTDLSLMNLPDMTSQQDVMDALEKSSDIVQAWVDQNKFVLTLGGEHTITPGVAKPYLDRYQKDITVVHIDAHADLKDTYDGFAYSHACAIRRIVDQSPILSIGIRSVDEQEFAFAKSSPLISTIYSHELDPGCDWIQRALDNIQTPYVYLTIDVDGLDPSIMPATGTPQPGGLEWFELLKFLKALCQKSKLIGADVNELCPIQGHHAANFLAAKLCYKILGYSTLS